MKRNVGILIFDDAEVLDFAGPFEVFAVASEVHNYELFNVFTVAKDDKPIVAVNGLSVNPRYNFSNSPKIDVLIISGGAGTRSVMNDAEILKWVSETNNVSEITASICSGARILAKLNLLDNKKYCTHKGAYDHMKKIVPSGIPQPNKRFVSDGKIFTSGGISAGIDLSFHILEILYDKTVVNQTAGYMEYDLKK